MSSFLLPEQEKRRADADFSSCPSGSLHPAVAATPHYLYLLPHPALRRHIAHYTLSRPGGPSGSATLRIVPDASGCIVCSRYAHELGLLFWGPTSRCVDQENDIHCTPRVFIEFRPCGAHSLLSRLPLDAVRDARLPLDHLDPALDAAIRHAFGHGSPSSLLDRLDALFIRRLEQDRESPLMAALVRHMTLSGGAAQVKDLSGLTGYSERHMNRVCRERLGLSLKGFARVLRINQACERLDKGHVFLTSLAQELGYYDQAHFIHDFQQVCGVSPSRYVRSVSDFYKEKYK